MNTYPNGMLVIARNRIYDVLMLGVILDADNPPSRADKTPNYTIRSTKLRLIRNPDGTARSMGYTKYVVKAADITPVPADQLNLAHNLLRDLYNAHG